MFEQPSRTDRDGLEDSSEQQLAADADVVVLRIAIAFFTACLRIETEVLSHLPVTIDAVIEARAVDVAGSNARLGAFDTRIGNRLIAAEEFMLDAAKQGDLEVTTIQIVNCSIVELLAKNEAPAAQLSTRIGEQQSAFAMPGKQHY